MMTPRFKGKPSFDFSLPCPLCGYKIQPNELMRLASHIIKCPKCSGVFDEMGGRKPISTS
jgi:Zn-finger nucleic acid-binding protein